ERLARGALRREHPGYDDVTGHVGRLQSHKGWQRPRSGLVTLQAEEPGDRTEQPLKEFNQFAEHRATTASGEESSLPSPSISRFTAARGTMYSPVTPCRGSQGVPEGTEPTQTSVIVSREGTNAYASVSSPTAIGPVI